MIVDLNEYDIEVLDVWLGVWDENNNLLPGGLCYQDVIDLCTKLGISQPKHLLAFLEKYDKKNSDERREGTQTMCSLPSAEAAHETPPDPSGCSH